MANIFKKDQPFLKWVEDAVSLPFVVLGAAATVLAWPFTQRSGNQALSAGQWLSDQFTYYTTMGMYRAGTALCSGAKATARRLDEFALRSGFKLKVATAKENIKESFAEYRDNSPKLDKSLKGIKRGAELAVATVLLPRTAYRATVRAKNNLVAGIAQRRADSISRREAELETLRQMTSPEGRLQTAVSTLQQGLEDLAAGNSSFAFNIVSSVHPVSGAPVAKIFTSLQDEHGQQIIFRVGADKVEMGSGGGVSQTFRSAAKAMKYIATQVPRERVEPHI